MPNEESIFNQFVGKYSLPKTLRFELKPVGKTLENMKKRIYKGKPDYDPELQTFLHDQDIENAYQALKPKIDELHEKFISMALRLPEAKDMDFSEYLNIRKQLFYSKQKARGKERTAEETDIQKLEDALDKEGEKLRTAFGKIFDKAGEEWKKEYSGYEWKKGSSIAKGPTVLSSQDILRVVGDENTDERIQDALRTLDKFFTYLGGYNQNRENYYETKKEAATAVATRIVYENLPRFAENAIVFELRRDEYLSAHEFLQKQGKSLVNKDGRQIGAIAEKVFDQEFFNQCLSQEEIEAYNRAIGDCNFVINNYNQAHGGEKGFRQLTIFKTLYKQIGCGEKDALFFQLTHECEADAEAERIKDQNKSFSVEKILQIAKKAGEKYFQSNGSEEVDSIPELIGYIMSRENYAGFYWSKAALNTISNRYFANWHTLKDQLKDAKVFKRGGKNDEENVKIPEAIELQPFFDILDNTEDWQKTLFKPALINPKDDHNKLRIIQEAKSSHEALLRMITEDMQVHADVFLKQGEDILNLTEKYFAISTTAKEKEKTRKEWKEAIKQWMDHALAINRMLKYFKVHERKAKGAPIDAVLAKSLDVLLGVEGDPDWFKWYDALRNFLTKKPQDEAKENKLKLNFENPSLAAGWDVNKEKDNYCVILQNEEKHLFLAIASSQHKSIFEPELIAGKGENRVEKNNPLYEVEETDSWLKMEYNFWADVSKMIPKCSTQLRGVVHHFKENKSDFIFPNGYKVSSGERFLEECRITKEVFDLNNKVYKKSNIAETAMRFELTDSQEKQYVKAFQKEYWELLLRKENSGKEYSKRDLFIEWKKFCGKNSNELSDWEKKYKTALTSWIDFCKYFLAKYPKTSKFKYIFKESEEYYSVDEFYRDVDICSYDLKLEKRINKTKLDELIDQGNIYLFEIKNQDLNTGKAKDHQDNIHTLYWRTLFKDVANRPKLSGGAEIFYRKALLDKDLKRKKVKDKDGEEREVIQNYRFSKEKFILHVPMTLNFCLNEKGIDEVVNEYFPRSNDIYFLGIDRGEKHLAYYSLVDGQGRILDSGSLNMPFVDKDGNSRTVQAVRHTLDKDGKEKELIVECKDYNDLLDARAGDRDYARKNWQTIGTIKDLKHGYISQVVHRIAKLAALEAKGPTYIVLEDLNTGFMRGRQKIEKSVYKQFEVAVAKKLNFLVDKSKDGKYDEIGSVTKAIQLTPPVMNFDELKERGKQAGVMLFVRPDYTSQTDPVTGWRKKLYIGGGSEESVRNRIVEAFEDIYFDGKDYVFSYIDEDTGNCWYIYSGKNGESLPRFHRVRGMDKGEWIAEPQDLTAMLDGLFADFDKSKSLLSQIVDEGTVLRKINEHTAWETLRFAINLIQQIRNSDGSRDGRGSDFIFSPVRDENGNHFDSRVYWDEEEKTHMPAILPSSGDANGAYNIARKGIILHEHMKRDLKLYVRDEEWDAWLAGKEAWEKWVNENNKSLEKQKRREK